MRVGPWQFQPALWPTLAAAGLVGLFVALGIWQLHRADYKRALLAHYAEESALPPVPLDGRDIGDRLAALPPYRRVEVDGHYDGSRQVLIEDIPRDGAVGYEVLTPLVLDPDGSLLLVDRGWVPAGNPGAAPPVPAPPGERRVRGVLGTLPVPGLRLGQSAPLPAGWPKRMFYPQHADLATLYGARLLTPVLRLDPAEPDGYRREASLDVGFPPVRHQAYALQWFALAAAVMIVWLVVNSRRRN